MFSHSDSVLLCALQVTSGNELPGPEGVEISLRPSGKIEDDSVIRHAYTVANGRLDVSNGYGAIMLYVFEMHALKPHNIIIIVVVVVVCLFVCLFIYLFIVVDKYNELHNIHFISLPTTTKKKSDLAIHNEIVLSTRDY